MVWRAAPKCAVHSNFTGDAFQTEKLELRSESKKQRAKVGLCADGSGGRHSPASPSHQPPTPSPAANKELGRLD